ncbi:MAG: hypothetical protein K2X27_21530 [Candidatus Obscuribacterales bacterium]|nr:hypothetical protein [Candidatus Obscuribacterales bacterium]
MISLSEFERIIESNLADSAQKLEDAPDFAQIQASLNYLDSKEALESIEIDPYWPKWHGPWWHMMLLSEMGLAAQIPKSTLLILSQRMNLYLDNFPISETEIPEGKDPLADIICHCQLGCYYQLLNNAGLNAEQLIPFSGLWFKRYQLPDGGFNCDESAYSSANPHSSIVSTVPILEALLLRTDKADACELSVLDRGADYLRKRRIYRSLSNGKVIKAEWTEIAFPLFYEYDILRGLRLLADWSYNRKKTIALSEIGEALKLLDQKQNRASLKVERQVHSGKKTRIRHKDGSWTHGAEARDFPLLRAVSSLNEYSEQLTKQWHQLLVKLKAIKQMNLIL